MTKYIVEHPNITLKRGTYPPKSKAEILKLVEKAKLANMHADSRTQCMVFKHQPQFKLGEQ